MGKRDKIIEKLQSLNNQDCDEAINALLAELEYNNIDCVIEYINDVDSDDEEISNIYQILEYQKEQHDLNNIAPIEPQQDSNNLDEIVPNLVKRGKQLLKVKDPDFKLPNEVFEDLAKAVADYSKYGSTHTVSYDGNNLIIDGSHARQTTVESSDKTAEHYKRLLNMIQHYAEIYTADNSYGAHCCLAKFYYKIVNLDHNICNQENAMNLAELLYSFFDPTTLTAIGMAGAMFSNTNYDKFL